MRIIVPDSYWISCGKPDVKDEFFRRCAFAGIGAAGYVAASAGASADYQKLVDLSDCLGYGDDVVIEVLGVTHVPTND